MRKNLFPILIFLLAGYNYRRQILSWITPQRIPYHLVAQGNCAGKKMCAIVYLAPWCPACHQISPIIKDAIIGFKAYEQDGMQVIMGGGREPGENEKAAKELDKSVLIDNDRKMFSQLKITVYPTFLVVDQKRQVIHKGHEALTWISEHTNL